MDNHNILAALEKAVGIYGEAQNAYDFQAYTVASEMRREASAMLFKIFAKAAVLRESFPDSWKLLERGDEDCLFFYPDLEIARKILLDPTRNNLG